MWYGTIPVEREKATHTQWQKSDEDWTEFWRRGQLRLEVNLIVLGTILNVRLKTTYSRPTLPYHTINMLSTYYMLLCLVS